MFDAAAAAVAATLNLDDGFGQGGYAAVSQADGSTPTGYAHLTPAGDGKFYAIAYGQPTWPQGYCTFDLVRVNADGSPDSSFAAAHLERVGSWYNFYSGETQPMDDSLYVGSLLVQDDGKVIVAARDVPYFSPDPILLMRFNPDGTADAGFGDGGTVTLPVDTSGQGDPKAWLLPDGKIDLIDVTAYNTPGQGMAFTIKQFNADGSADDSFGDGGVKSVPIAAEDLGQDPNGGWSNRLMGAAALPGGAGTAAYLEETSWSDDPYVQLPTEVRQVVFDAAGDVVATHALYRSAARDHHQWPYWGAETLLPLAVQPDGQAVVLDPGTGALMRFGRDGGADARFGVNGVAAVVPAGFEDIGGFIDVGADGKILVTLEDQTGLISGVVRVNTDGSPDAGFAAGQAVFGFGDYQVVSEAVELPGGAVVVSVLDHRTYYWWNQGGPGLDARLGMLRSDGGSSGTFDLAAEESAANAIVQQYWQEYNQTSGDADGTGDASSAGTTSDGGDAGNASDSLGGSAAGDGSDTATADDWTTLDGVGSADSASQDNPSWVNDGTGLFGDGTALY